MFFYDDDLYYLLQKYLIDFQRFQEDGKWSGQGSISSHRFNDPNEKGPWGVKEGANGELLTNMVNQAYITDNSVIRDRVIDKSRAERVQKKIHGVRSMSELDSLFITSNTTDVSLSSIGLRNEVHALLFIICIFLFSLLDETRLRA